MFTQSRTNVSVKWDDIGSSNGLSPVGLQVFTWTSVDVFFLGPLGTNFSEVRIKIKNLNFFMEMHLKISSAKWRSFFRVSWCGGAWIHRILELLTEGRHYGDVIMGAIASQMTSLTIVYSTTYFRRSKKASKLRVTGLCVGNSPVPVNSSHKWPVTRKTFPFDDVIMVMMPMLSHWRQRRLS